MKKNYFKCRLMCCIVISVIIANKSIAQTIKDDPRHYISRDVAANYILNYAKNFTSLATDASNTPYPVLSPSGKGAWTELNISDVKSILPNKALHDGLIMWCYQETDGSFKIAFDIITLNDVFNPDDYVSSSSNTTFLHSTCTYLFKNTHIVDKSSLNTAMIFPFASPSCTYSTERVPKTTLSHGMDTFKKVLNEFPNPINPNDRYACFYAAGFIHINQLSNLLNKNLDENHRPVVVKGLRVFWGYDPSIPELNNRLKLILVGVDGAGNNIWNQNAVILEHSWPPF